MLNKVVVKNFSRVLSRARYDKQSAVVFIFEK